MKWLTLLLALVALPAFGQTVPPTPTNATKAKLVSPKYAEHVTSLAPLYHVKRVKDLGAAKLILYQPTSKTSKLAIPGRKGIVPFAAPVPTLKLVWNWVDTYSSQPGYPTNYVTNIVFEVWQTTQLSLGLAGFTLAATVSSTNYSISLPYLPQQFFVVRARDRITGVASDWNQP